MTSNYLISLLAVNSDSIWVREQIEQVDSKNHDLPVHEYRIIRKCNVTAQVCAQQSIELIDFGCELLLLSLRDCPIVGSILLFILIGMVAAP